MKKSNWPSPLRATDYEAIEAALLETARGRWFLSEYSTRNRRADTNVLLEAIGKLQASVYKPQVQQDNSVLREPLTEMAQAISRARNEIAATRMCDGADCQSAATDELDGIVEATGKATSDILEAAEDIKDLAWLLREKGIGGEACDSLDARADKIDTACSVHTLTGECMVKVIGTLHLLESCVHAMIENCGVDANGVEERPASQIPPPNRHRLENFAMGEPAGPTFVRVSNEVPSTAGDRPPDAALAASGEVDKAVKKIITDSVDAEDGPKAQRLAVEALEDVQEPALFT